MAEDTARGDRCVLKLLPPRASARRLRGEFARLTELSHPNIVRIRDGGVLGSGALAGRAYLATDYLAGLPLAESLPSGPLEARVAAFADAAEALVDALAYLHGRGILHGDLSPANVRCDESGKPFLIDFGLGDWIGAPATSAGQGATGTLGFLAPEALLGERGPAGDLFAVGATLYDAWTGVAPFGVGMEAVRRAWDGAPPAPSSLHPGLPPGWDDLLLRMLASAVEDRPRSARAVLQEIRRLLPGRAVEVADDLVGALSRRRSFRRGVGRARGRAGPAPPLPRGTGARCGEGLPRVRDRADGFGPARATQAGDARHPARHALAGDRGHRPRRDHWLRAAGALRPDRGHASSGRDRRGGC